MVKMTHNLTPEAWIEAGFRALVSEGPNALRVEPLARALGVTKGSFYWHFADLAVFRTAMLDHWQAKAYSETVSRLENVPDGLPRLKRLTELAMMIPDEKYGGAGAEPALRDWARWDVAARERLKTVDAARLAYLEERFTIAGAAPGSASVYYACYIGCSLLRASDGMDRTNDMLVLLDSLMSRQR